MILQQVYNSTTCIRNVTRMTRSLSSFSREYDPTARTPTKKCDPYGQEGKPLTYDKAMELLQTLDTQWTLQLPQTSIMEGVMIKDVPPPVSLYRQFYHASFMDGAKFLSVIAAVAHNNNHFPEISLQRRLVKDSKGWEFMTLCTCYTPTLKGLSHHDFHLALMVDVEVARPEYQRLLLVRK